MSTSRAPMRWRFFAAGAGAILTAITAGGLVDRALVLAEVAPQVRFAASATVMLLLLVGPLMLSLERWVIRPLEALDGLHDTRKGARDGTLASRDLPREMAEVISHHTEMLTALESTNERLQQQVHHRTEALEVIIAAADALNQHRAPSTLPSALLPVLARLDSGCAAALVHSEDDRWVATILPPAPLLPDTVEDLERRIQRVLGKQQHLRVRWLPPINPKGTPVRSLRVLARQSLDTDRSPAAVALLSVHPAGLLAAGEDLRRVLRTIGTWLARVDTGAATKVA